MADPRMARILRDGIDALGLEKQTDAEARLLAYVDLLDTWNGAYNLTAVRNRLEMVSRHLLDSLAIAPFVNAGALLDVGSGAGLPGVVLAIWKGDFPVTVVDSNGKKARFLRHVKRTLALDNLDVVQDRIEAVTARPWPQVTARAFAPPERLLPLVAGLLTADGQVLAMTATAEVAGVPGFKLVKAAALAVPGVAASRHVLVYQRWQESSQ